jgi:glutathione S-transferase
MAITFYGAPNSSAVPVACALNELALPHERINLDLASKAQKKPEFLALNPNGKVPTLVVDGTPMFEALAIVQWLGDRHGVEKGLWPAFDAPARLSALSWTTWAYVTFAAPLHRFALAASQWAPAELRSEAHAAHANAELQHLLGLLDERLAKQPCMLGNDYTLVDSLLANMLRYAAIVGLSSDAHARVAAWLERCHARPAMRAEWG